MWSRNGTEEMAADKTQIPHTDVSVVGEVIKFQFGGEHVYTENH